MPEPDEPTPKRRAELEESERRMAELSPQERKRGGIQPGWARGENPTATQVAEARARRYAETESAAERRRAQNAAYQGDPFHD